MKAWQEVLAALSEPMSPEALSEATERPVGVVRLALRTLVNFGGATPLEGDRYERTPAGWVYLKEMHTEDVPADIAPGQPTGADAVVKHAKRHALPSVWDLARAFK